MKQKLTLVVGARTEIVNLQITCEFCETVGTLSIPPENLIQRPEGGWTREIEWEHSCLPWVEEFKIKNT